MIHNMEGMGGHGLGNWSEPVYWLGIWPLLVLALGLIGPSVLSILVYRSFPFWRLMSLLNLLEV